MSFFPIDRGIFTSSVWLTGTSEEKVLWLWLLGNRDDDGVVRHRELAIAYGTGLARAVVEAGLLKFSEPDEDSRTRNNDGRRIGRTPDGFVRILNHELYYSKDYSTPRWRAWKERKGLKGSETVGQQSPALENVGPTKDKDKDKDKDVTTTTSGLPGGPSNGTPPAPAKPPKRGKGKAPDCTEPIAAFNRAFALAFKRRATLPPDKAAVFAARAASGYPLEFLAALPVIVQAAGLAKGRDVQPAFLLRDGSGTYVRDGARRSTFDWIGAAWSAADKLLLTREQADILRDVGALEWLSEKGATIYAAANEC